VNVPAVYRRLYEDMPLAKLALLGIALERIQRFEDGTLTLVALDAVDFDRAGAEESFSEGIVDHLRSVVGTKVAVLIRELTAPESGGKRKVSLRATGDDIDVSVIARTQGGGGHRRAAGFSTILDAPELISLLRHEVAAQVRRTPNGPPVPTLA
jgi:phosphoesterase RecJ-like protein